MGDKVAAQSETAIQAGVPDYDACKGSKTTKIMAQRIVSLCLLSRQLLSMQQHYEWKLRSLKPILSLAGRLLQDHKRNHGEPPNDGEEAILLIKAVRRNTMSN